MQKIAVTAEQAAKLLSLDLRDFLQAVRDSDLPMPISIAGHTRWLVGDLESETRCSASLDGRALAPLMHQFGIDE